MQNTLETLGLFFGTTREFEYVEDEFVELAIDGKVVEFAAMPMVANRKLYDIKGEVYEIIEGSIHDKDSTPNVESVHWLLRVFDDVGYHITKYIKEDKYNVTKYQAIEDVTCMLLGTDLAPLELSDTDLSVYSWGKDEEDTDMKILVMSFSGLEEKVLAQYTFEKANFNRATVANYFLDAGVQWGSAPAVKGVRDATVELLHTLVVVHAEVFAGCKPLLDKTLGILIEGLIDTLLSLFHENKEREILDHWMQMVSVSSCLR